LFLVPGDIDYTSKIARHGVGMQVPDPTILERENLDASVGEVPNAEAVFGFGRAI